MLALNSAARPPRVALAIAVAGFCVCSASDAGPATQPPGTLPHLVLWAWERPEDLRSAGRDVGVAFLAQTITLLGPQSQAPARSRQLPASGFRIAPRMQPLRVAGNAVLMAVTRIDGPAKAGRHVPSDQPNLPDPFDLPDLPDPPDPSDPPDPPDLPGRPDPPGTTAVLDAVAAAIARTATLPRVAGVQVDFDATASQRAFYRDLLARVRAQLAPGTTLSITALASWCVGDDWLGDLPIDEAVPMLFRMGPVNQPYLHLAQSRGDARVECRGALGVSVDEPRAIDSARRRVYVFNPKPWTARTIADARREALR